MDGYVRIVIYYGESFYRYAQEKCHYWNGMDDVKLIKNTCTLRKLRDVVYTTTCIKCDNWVAMKFIFYLIYNLDLIKIKNDEDVSCFILE